MRLFYHQPAPRWVEGLPQGNGRLGIMALGGVAQERIALNEDTLWSGHPGNHIRPGSYEHILKAQELVLAGRAREARRSFAPTCWGRLRKATYPWAIFC